MGHSSTPKKRGARNAKKKGALETPPKAAASSSTKLTKLTVECAAEATPSKRRKLDRSGVKQEHELRREVRKACRDNLKFLTPAEIHHNTVDGYTCFDRMLRDRKAYYEGGEDAPDAIGMYYYRNLREKYQTKGGPANALEVKGDTPPDPVWLKAVTLSRLTPPKRDKLFDLLETRGPCSQTDLVGLLTHGLEVQPSDIGPQCDLILKISHYIAKHSLDATFPSECAAFSRHADKTYALVQAALVNSDAELGTTSFWESYRDDCRWCMPVARVDRLLNVKENESWDDHQDDLDACTSASVCCQQMFAGALKTTVFSRVRATIERVISKHFDGKGITEETKQACRDECSEELAKMHIPETPGGRVVTLTWLGDPIPVTVDGVTDEVNLRIDRSVKDRGMTHVPQGQAQRSLALVFGEEDLARVPPRRDGLPVAGSMLKKYAASRKALANKLTTLLAASIGEAVVESLADAEECLKMVSPSIVIEIAWYRYMCTSGCEARLRSRVEEDLLPNAVGKHDVKRVAEQVEALKTTLLYRCCNEEGQASINQVASWLVAIANQRCPSVTSITEDSWLATAVKPRLAFFAYYDEPGSSSSPAETKGGAEAMVKRFEKMEARIASAEEVTLDELRYFHSFAWLLTTQQEQKHREWVRALYERGCKGSAQVVLESGKEKTVSKKSAANRAQVEASTLELFKKKKKSNAS